MIASTVASPTARGLPRRMSPLAVRRLSVACGTGIGSAALKRALRSGRSTLAPNRFAPAPLATWTAMVDGLDEAPWPASWSAWECRATRLAWLGLQADGFVEYAKSAIARIGAARVGLVLGTSASTIGASELAYRTLEADGEAGDETIGGGVGRFPAALAHERLNTPHALAMFVQQALGLGGPCVTVSTACSSSAKAFGQAQRWLSLGLVDAVVVGGVDALCASVIYGFQALGLVSESPCRPFDVQRRGISIGEAASFVWLERDDAGNAPLQLQGHGESTDAHHMSSPHPEGAGAELALSDALARAGLESTAAIDYVNLHGTGTPKNDEVEAAFVARRYGPATALGATKGLTGHTMGAAGLLEAVVCLLALEQGFVPGTAHTEVVEPALADRLVLTARPAALRVAASHSFGFGGNNSVLIFGRAGNP